MAVQHVFFAGGGTGGHIYPALAIAQQLENLQPNIKITFFCSDRKIDSDILSKTPYEFIQLPAVGFSAHPVQLAKFLLGTFKSYKKAKCKIAQSPSAAMVGVGGFVSAGPVLAGHKLGIPTMMVNTDSVPGKANIFLARYVDEIFAHFDFTKSYFTRCPEKVIVTGCPLRAEFCTPDATRVINELDLDPAKKVLLITGASSGAKTINQAMCAILDKFAVFADQWQIVHLTGKAEYKSVNGDYAACPLSHKVLDYYDQMADLLACADLVIGRAGAVSVAEYAAAGVPCICMPYPFHKDNHQRKNAQQLEKAGCCIIIDDKIDAQANAAQLWPQLEKLMGDAQLLESMRTAARQFGHPTAAADIARRILAR